MQVRPGIDLSKRVGLVVRPGDVDVQYPFAPGESMPNTGYGVAFLFKAANTDAARRRGGGQSVQVRKRPRRSTRPQGGRARGRRRRVGGRRRRGAVRQRLRRLPRRPAGGATLPFRSSSRSRGRAAPGSGSMAAPGSRSASTRTWRSAPCAPRKSVALRATADSAAAPDLVVETTVAVSAALPVRVLALRHRGPPALAFTAGNAGPFDIDAGFVPPNGAGVRIDSGTVVGGGFLLYDPAHSRYAGILQLEVAGLAITAIGLLTTRLPDDTRAIRSSSRSAPRSRRSRSASASPSRASAASSW